MGSTFDWKEDPGENKNLVEDTRYTKLREELRNKPKQRMQET